MAKHFRSSAVSSPNVQLTVAAKSVPDWYTRATQCLAASRPRDAEAILTHVFVADRTNHTAIYLLAIAARDDGRQERALSLLLQASQLAGDNAAYEADLAFSYLQMEQPDRAADHYRHVLALDPAAHRARFGLGVAHMAAGDAAAAAAALREFVDCCPEDPDGQLHLARALYTLARYHEAAPFFERAIGMRPDHSAGHQGYAECLLKLGHLQPAAEHAARALATDPNEPDIAALVTRITHASADSAGSSNIDEAALLPGLYELAQNEIRLGRFDEAGWCYRRALTIVPGDSTPYEGLAQVRYMEGRTADARSLTMEARRCGADPAATETMLGQIHEAEGDFDAAITAYERAIAIRPTESIAQLQLALLRKPAEALKHLDTLIELGRTTTLDGSERATLSFALGRTLDSLGRYDEAYAHFKAANEARLIQCGPQKSAAVKHAAIASVFTEELLQHRHVFGNESRRPVFIVGMMRSGTTLLEQILSSHPMVYGHGELNDIRRISLALPRAVGSQDSYPDCVPLLNEVVAKHFAERYLARLEREAPHVARSIDKLPHNFQFVGLIALLFPNARILHMVRDPVDTCLSNYFHDFGPANVFTYDLRQLGEYYRNYAELMAYWEDMLPCNVLSIPYEGLVADQETWSRKAVAFLDIEWDPACLAFHNNHRTVNTLSVWQVRQPMYTTAVARWTRYRRHLGPLFDALGVSPD